MKTRLLITIGIFLAIFSMDAVLLLDSSIPECKGFVLMGWFVFFHMGFEPMAILSNPECLTSFYTQTGALILLGIGVFLILYPVTKKYKNKIHCEN